MTIEYKTIVPWGRSYQEYVNMFNLNEQDLNKNILGCGDGPANFNYTMTQNNKRIISIDPIYQFTKKQIKTRIDETYHEVILQTKNNKDKFIWKSIKNIDELTKIRMDAMLEFLNDYENGLKEKRYIYAELPNLPFEDKQFELSLSSHFLFLYSENLSLDFHISAIKEMCRISKEVRIFPLLNLNSEKSEYLDSIISMIKKLKLNIEICNVNYEFQKNGNQMLRIY